jgi:uncharacterized protein (TIGR00369 family)
MFAAERHSEEALINISEVVMKIRKKHMNPFRGLHGGVYASAIDTAAYWSAYCDLPEENGLVSIDLKVDFLAPVLEKKSLSKGRELNLEKPYILPKRRCVTGNEPGKEGDLPVRVQPRPRKR